MICGLGGNDVISAEGGDDLVLGGPGNDVIVTGAGSDVVFAGPGADLVSAWDCSPDDIDGGPGFDRVWRDRTIDHVRNVERFG